MEVGEQRLGAGGLPKSVIKTRSSYAVGGVQSLVGELRSLCLRVQS